MARLGFIREFPRGGGASAHAGTADDITRDVTAAKALGEEADRLLAAAREVITVTTHEARRDRAIEGPITARAES